MLTQLSDSRPRNRASWACSLLLHVAAASVLAVFGTRVLGPAKVRRAAILIAPVLPSEPKHIPLAPPKPKQLTLPKLRQETAREMHFPALLQAPPVQVAVSVPAPALASPPPAMAAPPAPVPKVVPPPSGFDISRSQARPERQPALELQEGSAFAQNRTVAAPERVRTVQADSGFGAAFAAKPSPTARATSASTEGFGEPARAAAGRKQVEIARGSFGDAEVAKHAARATREPENAPGDTTPVEITFQPRPAYTEEARRLKIEGQVLVEVVLTASGEIRVVRIIRGLGHGLNENAIAAIGGIRFRPAQRQGKSIDTTATVRMNFELAF